MNRDSRISYVVPMLRECFKKAFHLITYAMLRHFLTMKLITT